MLQRFRSTKRRGGGAGTPLFDNLSPEARSFNRTVTITLEYMSAEQQAVAAVYGRLTKQGPGRY